MDQRTEFGLGLAAANGAFVAGLIHLHWGLPRLLVYLPRGTVVDPRPYLFVPSALLLFAVGGLVALDRAGRRVHLLGAAVLLGYLAGYAWWHLTGHGGLTPVPHGGNPLFLVLDHLLGDPVALVAAVAELLGAGALLALAATDE